MDYENETKVSRDTHLDREIKIFSEDTKRLLSNVQELHMRLSPVLREQPKSEEVGVPEEMLVPVADRIRKIRYQVSEVGYIVQSILSRLEV